MLRFKSTFLPFVFFTLTIATLVLFFTPPHASASALDTREFRKTCRNTDSPNYRPDQAVTIHDKQILLINNTTDEVLEVLFTGVEWWVSANYYWTQNCRYIMALNTGIINDRFEHEPGYHEIIQISMMFDTFTGQKIGEWGDDGLFETRYSPTREQFIMLTSGGTYLMSERMTVPVLVDNDSDFGLNLRQYEWDVTHQQLRVVFYRNNGYVQLFDYWAGEQRAVISNPDGCEAPLNFAATSDEQYLISYTRAGQSFTKACVSVYNYADGSIRQVPTGEATGSRKAAIALSPDGRYLVVGWYALRVWDLNNLPANFDDRQPIYRHEGPIKVITAVRFIDSQTIETTSGEGVQRWNILTGEAVSISG
jgi:WD40 repeat protein